MNEQPADQLFLSCKLKCSIIKDLFSQILKNTKSSHTFYLNLNRDGIKMIFVEKDKEVQIYVHLSREMFQLYQYLPAQAQICMYDIKDLDLIGLIFENQSAVLQFQFKKEGFKVWHVSEFLGEIVYNVQAHEIIEEIPQQVRSTASLISNQLESHTKIQLPKMKCLSNVLHTLTLQKIESLQLHFKSVNSQIEIVPLPEMISSNNKIEDSDQVYTIAVKYLKTQMLDHLRFNVKKFKTCLALFEKNNRILLTFYRNQVKLQVIEKDKKNVQIVLACLADV